MSTAAIAALCVSQARANRINPDVGIRNENFTDSFQMVSSASARAATSAAMANTSLAAASYASTSSVLTSGDGSNFAALQSSSPISRTGKNRGGGGHHRRRGDPTVVPALPSTVGPIAPPAVVTTLPPALATLPPAVVTVAPTIPTTVTSVAAVPDSGRTLILLLGSIGALALLRQTVLRRCAVR